VQYVVQLVNKTNNNLYVYVPTAQSDGNYKEAKIAIAEGATKSLLYTNPPPGTAMNFRVTKQSCLGGCTNYLMNWDWHPYQTDGTGKSGRTYLAGYTPCSASLPQFVSGQTYKVELNDKRFENYNDFFAAGLLSGPIGGAGTADKTCTFNLQSSLVNWFKENPVKGFLIVTAAVIIIAALVVLTVATFGAAAPLDAAVEGLIAEGVLEVAGEAAAEGVIEEVEAESIWNSLVTENELASVFDGSISEFAEELSIEEIAVEDQKAWVRKARIIGLR